MRIVGEVRVKAPGGMLRRQLEAAATARGRWLAAQALARTSDEASVSALGRVLAEEREFWGVRAECAAALGKIRGDRAFAALLAARRTTHPKVRRAVVEAIGRFRTADAQAVLQEYARRDASYLVEAEAARALGRTRQPAAFEALVSMLDRPSWFDVVRAGAIEGLAALRDERAVAPLHARVRPGYPQRVRRAAVSGLTKLAPDRKTRDALELLLEDADAILRMDVARSLGDLGDVKARGALRERLEIDDDPRVRRRIREALRDLAEPKRITDQLRDEIERLEHEQVGLKARLARLEAKAGGDAEQDRGKERAGGTGSRGRARRARPAKRAAGTRPKRRSR
jgi:aminopeptidase N